MKSNILIIAVILLSAAINSCNKDEENDIDLILGDYVGNLYYWNAYGEIWNTFDHIDFPNEKEIILTIKKSGTNYIVSFEKSIIRNFSEMPEIPDLNIDIAPTKSSDVYEITILSDQAYIINEHERYKFGLPKNSFQIDMILSTVYCDIHLKNNDKLSTQFFEMALHKKINNSE